MTKKTWLGALLVLAAVGIAVASIVNTSGDTNEAVRTALAEKKDITQKVLAQGKVRARTQVEVASEIGGRVKRVDVKAGQLVKEGEPLFAIDDEQLQNAVEQLRVAGDAAQAMVKRAELALSEATRGVERDEKLKDKGVIPEEQLRVSVSRQQLAQADLDQAKAALERNRLDLQRARDALRRARVTAPKSGTVVAVGVEVGQVVSPVTGMSAMSDMPSIGLAASAGPAAPVIIADLDELIVKLDVDELDVGLVKIGQHAVLRAQGIKDLVFDGTVERVGLIGRDQAGAVLFVVEVKVDSTARDTKKKKPGASDVDAGVVPAEQPEPELPLPPPKEVLRPGMSVQAEIEVQTIADAVSVPVAAVLESDGEDGDDRVFVYEGNDAPGAVGVAKEAKVKLGPSEGDDIAILHGVEVGQRVVAGPFRALKGLEDGDKVTLEAKDKDKGGKDKDKGKGDKADKKGESKGGE